MYSELSTTIAGVEESSNELQELAAAIGELPVSHRDRLAPMLERVQEDASRRRRILQMVQDSLGQLRLDMKYLLFDLEATRRERDAYQSELENR